MTTYTLREIQAMLGISRSAISSLMAAGFVSPGRGQRREYRFTFQDVVMLRTAHSLREAQIPGRKILRSLRRLRDSLPSELPLSGLRITAAGNEVAVREGTTQWQIDSGQLLLDFEIRPSGASVSLLSKPLASSKDAAPNAPVRGSPDEGADKPASVADAGYWFERGTELEDDHPAAAEAAYRKAVALEPAFSDAYLNLGCLLGAAGRCADAISLYRTALQHRPDEPLLHFNLAVALEDHGRPAEALACYEKCLELSPDFSDAHYNAALLCEKLGQASKAIKHFSAVRRLQKHSKHTRGNSDRTGP